MYKTVWKEDAYLPCNEILAKTNSNMFPIINKLLRLFYTIPVSNATAERSFSNLKNLKDSLCSTMLNERLNGLNLMYIHREEIDVNEVIEKFSVKNRKIILT